MKTPRVPQTKGHEILRGSVASHVPRGGSNHDKSSCDAAKETSVARRRRTPTGTTQEVRQLGSHQTGKTSQLQRWFPSLLFRPSVFQRFATGPTLSTPTISVFIAEGSEEGDVGRGERSAKPGDICSWWLRVMDAPASKGQFYLLTRPSLPRKCQTVLTPAGNLCRVISLDFCS